MQRWWLVAGLTTSALALGWGLTLSEPAVAVIPEISGGQTKGETILDKLSDPQRSQAALEALVREGDIQTLSEIAEGSVDTSARGWAVVGLARIGDSASARVLQRIQDGREHPMLVRTWAAAARVGGVEDLDELQRLAQLQHSFPGLDRPLRLKAESLLGGASLEQLLRMSTDGNMAQLVNGVILSRADERGLVELMYHHKDDVVRRQAAAFAGTLATQDPQGSQVHELVLDALALRSRPGDVPWAGGALYVPGIQRDQADSRELVRTLAGWWLQLEASGRGGELKQVWNNLYSYQLLTTAGYDMGLSADPQRLVEALIRVEGEGAVRELLTQIGLGSDRRFSGVLR
ncbi:MAG TPA: hypothetical protein ENK18_05760 [Deltaproteobacteria bacterium]|nr:hypothetical protein [Deltaproteobacteria bacterium]